MVIWYSFDYCDNLNIKFNQNKKIKNKNKKSPLSHRLVRPNPTPHILPSSRRPHPHPHFSRPLIFTPSIRFPLFLTSLQLWLLHYPSSHHWFDRRCSCLHNPSIAESIRVEKLHGFRWEEEKVSIIFFWKWFSYVFLKNKMLFLVVMVRNDRESIFCSLHRTHIKEKWSINELLTMCVQEEWPLMEKRERVIYAVPRNKRKNKSKSREMTRSNLRTTLKRSPHVSSAYKWLHEKRSLTWKEIYYLRICETSRSQCVVNGTVHPFRSNVKLTCESHLLL